MSRRFSALMAAVALGSALSMVAVDANAGITRGGGFGSRGSRTWTPPAATQMSPAPTSPFNRTTQQPGMQQQQRPGMAAQPQRPGMGGFLSRPGFLGGLAAGFLGAGLFGMLMGHGLFGGLGGLSSILGLLLQLAIVFFVARWLIGWWQRRNQPAYAGGAPAPAPSSTEPYRQAASSVPTGGSRGYGEPAMAAPAAPQGDRLFDPSRDQVGLGQPDLDAFERLLSDIQLSYGRQDVNTLRQFVTPELLGYMQDDLRGDAEHGMLNRISNVRLLDGDLSEAWREGEADYATVAMRYAIEDVTVSRTTGEIIERGPPEVTEYWTFVRPRGGAWQLSAVQPAE